MMVVALPVCPSTFRLSTAAAAAGFVLVGDCLAVAGLDWTFAAVATVRTGAATTGVGAGTGGSGTGATG